MKELLDAIGGWFESVGVHPVLGAAIAGALLALMLRGRRRGGDGVEYTGAAVSGGGARAVTAGVRSVNQLRVTVAGSEVEVPAEQSDAIFAAIAAGNTIEAIKLLRAATGLGLAEAKGVVDALARAQKS